jgi:hypothetical protein
MADACYLAEWYRSTPGNEPLDRTAAKLDDSAAALSANGSPVRLLTMFSVPPDDMVFALFAAVSFDVVAEACGRAGIPPQRLTSAAGLVLPGTADRPQ